MEKKTSFDTCLYGVCENARQVLALLPSYIKENTQEIRLRANRPIALTVMGKIMYITNWGEVTYEAKDDLLILEQKDIEDSFRLICSGSVYAHADELKSGFVIMKNGHRAGICGTLTSGGIMHSISSINIRIARQVLGSADEILNHYNGGGILIAGPPASGKTTVLRDLIRLLSLKQNKRISVIDSRGEISGSYIGNAFCDLGNNTDILITENKALGIDICLRTMFPDIIAFDEISTIEELNRIENGFNCGVDIITTAHIGQKDELLKRTLTRNLIKSGIIKLAVLLSNNKKENMTFLTQKDLYL